jgi:hypothetical protein
MALSTLSMSAPQQASSSGNLLNISLSDSLSFYSKVGVFHVAASMWDTPIFIYVSKIFVYVSSIKVNE